MLTSIAGSFGYGRRYVSLGAWGPEVGGSSGISTSNLVAWFDPSYINTSYITVNDFDTTSRNHPEITSLTSRVGSSVATPTSATNVPAYVAGYNLTVRSEAPNSGFIFSGFTSSPNTATVPVGTGTLYDGQLKADSFIFNSGTGYRRYYENISASNFTVGDTVTYSIYAKAIGTAPYDKIGVGLNWVQTTNRWGGAIFDLTSGTYSGVMGSSASGHPYGATYTALDGYSITPVGTNGWYRISVTKILSGSLNSGSNLSPEVWGIQTIGGVDTTQMNVAAGSASSGYYLWGKMTDKSATVRQYTRTGNSSMTPPAAVFSTNQKALAGWNDGVLTYSSATLQVSPTIPLSRNMSIFSLFFRRASATSTIILGNSADSDLRGPIWNTSNQVTVGLNQNATPINFGTSTSTGFFISSIVMNSSTVSIWLNGTQFGTSQSAPADPTGQVFDRLGAASVFGTTDGLIGEVLVYSSAMTTAERQTIEGYLAHKYGQQALLPANHPYKTTAPTS